MFAFQVGVQTQSVFAYSSQMFTTGNADIQVQKLRLLKSNYLSEKYELEDKIIKYYPKTIAQTKETIAGLEKDISLAKEHPKPLDDTFVGIDVYKRQVDRHIDTDYSYYGCSQILLKT